VPRASSDPDAPREEKLDELVRIEAKAAEAAEAAATAASHAVEATKAAEAASVARAAKRAKTAKTAKAAKAANTAKSKASQTARAAAAAAEATAPSVALPDESAEPRRTRSNRLVLRLTDDELDLIKQSAAEKDLHAPEFARSTLLGALARPDET
jgi:hypothetical protein